MHHHSFNRHLTAIHIRAYKEAVMKITDPKTLSNYLRNERKTLGLSQAKVGDLVGLRQGTFLNLSRPRQNAA